MNGIKLGPNANGAVSVSGNVTSFSMVGCLFTSIKTGNKGGALYLNVVDFSDNEDAVIENCVFGSCEAVDGGAIYLASSGISLYDVNFTGNIASGSGNDIFFASTSLQTFYTTTSLELCCSFSEIPRFSLSDGSNLDELLPHCGSFLGERYVSCNDSYDDMNTCLNQNNPCRSLAMAISRAVEAGDEVVEVMVMGEYDDVESVIYYGVYVHISSD
jgi:hypothetical protein